MSSTCPNPYKLSLYLENVINWLVIQVQYRNNSTVQYSTEEMKSAAATKKYALLLCPPAVYYLYGVAYGTL